ncbi:unnamed protein product [Dovyalis caffra]|uniref:Exostosin GT47 domain-containing protein n=1 Tax=Dovyalis caffra TaxID=77055 RepID=A0AAV1R9N7_9ROSI|nr:unnamed protein product [Dovyalis caffra]
MGQASSKLDKNDVFLLKHNYDNFIDTNESNFGREHRNSDEGIIKETGHIADSTMHMDTNATGTPIDNFFTGGDWDKYLHEASDFGKESKPDNQIHLTENEARSINKVFGKGNKEESGHVRTAAREKQVKKPRRKRVKKPADHSLPREEKVIKEVIKQPSKEDQIGSQAISDSDSESCVGRYIYIHNLPSRFNGDLVRHCQSLNEWSNMCPYLSNFGFGPPLKNSERVLSNTGWYYTNQFMLEIIFHHKMKQYRCLTTNSSLASAIFVPYYSGLDVARYLWNADKKMKDYYSRHLVKWLRESPEWKRLWGRDHFMVAGRITWDFRRLTNKNTDWGNQLMILPESRNMTVLTIESSPWNNNDFAIPYPTYFHPSSDNEVFQWQNRMRRLKRQYLFSFVGGPRPDLPESIRSEIIEQCQAASRKCQLLKCITGSSNCYEPANLMRMFQSSTFCLQPPGDSFTRRSTFDSILAGCIPVFFHPGSAYAQYLWHLPRGYTEYSVFIPANKIKDEKVSIERTLSRIPIQRVWAMREQVINLIPGIVYADPSSGLETLKDAFDLTIDGVLERVEKIKMVIKAGKNFSEDIEEYTWKKILFGTEGKHEWDHFFDRSKMRAYN